eukprot:scaffold29570_cov154-Skeletonema_menzelii.AAC.2
MMKSEPCRSATLDVSVSVSQRSLIFFAGGKFFCGSLLEPQRTLDSGLDYARPTLHLLTTSYQPS